MRVPVLSFKFWVLSSGLCFFISCTVSDARMRGADITQLLAAFHAHVHDPIEISSVSVSGVESRRRRGPCAASHFVDGGAACHKNDEANWLPAVDLSRCLASVSSPYKMLITAKCCENSYVNKSLWNYIPQISLFSEINLLLFGSIYWYAYISYFNKKILTSFCYWQINLDTIGPVNFFMMKLQFILWNNFDNPMWPFRAKVFPLLDP